MVGIGVYLGAALLATFVLMAAMVTGAREDSMMSLDVVESKAA
jgi:hypothetical protein